MTKINVAINHFKTVCKHKYYVFLFCRECGITWRGIKHDLSKFTPTEFLESVKYYTGTRSPIDKCKEINGVSYAWMHHKGRNDHHREYWVDNVDNGGVAIDMPFECAVEMICDHLGAGKAYHGKNFSFIDEFKWYNNLLEKNIKLPHPHIKLFEYEVLLRLALIDAESSKMGSYRFDPLVSTYKLFMIKKPNKILNKKKLSELYVASNVGNAIDELYRLRAEYEWLYK